MTTEVNGTEPQEDDDLEVVDLFAKDFDDKLLAGDDSAEPVAVAHKDEDDSAKPAVEDDNGLPDKYKGKNIHEIVEMHQNLEKAYGRHNNELGELRKLTDQFLQQQLGGKKDDEQDALDADQLLADPDSVLKSRIENSPRLKELEAKLVARERADNLNAFNRAYPKAQEQINDPRFAKWIEQSPTRAKLLAQADQSYDYELMGELLTTFSALTGGADEAASDAKETKRKLTNANPSGSQAGSTKKKPVFTRKQLAKLQIEDPRRYEQLQDVIMDAYENGRVR